MTLEEVAGAVEVDIVFGVYPGNSHLTEEALTTRFGVKRHLARAVFAQLEKMGFVRRIPNRGVVVNELDPRDVDEIYEIRVLLEVKAARLTPLPAAAEVVTELERIQDLHEAAVRGGNFRQVFFRNIDFHRVQYSVCPNRHLTDSIHDFSRRAHMIRAIKYSDAQHMQNIIKQHREIIAAMKGSDHDAYAKAVESHFPASPRDYREYFQRKYGLDATEESRTARTELSGGQHGEDRAIPATMTLRPLESPR